MKGWASPYIDRLAAGEVVQFRPRGHSMTPRIPDRSLVTVEPCGEPDIGDAVLCTVGARQFLHIVKAAGPRGFLIANAKGRENGWTRSIHGRVVEVVP